MPDLFASHHLPKSPPRGERGLRRSRQDGWLGTRVRESQMTCVRVRVTTSSEVVHRRHRDEKEHKGATKRKKKRNDILGESRQEPTHISALRFWVRNVGPNSSLRSHLCVKFPESLRPHPPSQDRKLRGRKERETGQRETYTTHRVQWGEE